MIKKGIEKMLIEYCAPTLAGIKCAGLFNYFHEGEETARRELDEINKLLNKKGVNVEILASKEKSALLYVYRATMLESELKQPGVFELLESYGYKSCDVYMCLQHLKHRFFEDSCFPHEIGVFLGYPLEDVKGFIANKGENCEGCGMWKVYCNKEEKDKMFLKLEKCKEVYLRVFHEGRELSRMIV